MKKITSSFNFSIYLFVFLISITSYAQSIATYNISFESIWESVASNPTNGQSNIDLPGGAHWSDLVIVTHKTTDGFLMMDAPASAGIESIAETGATGMFQTEVNNNTDANQFVNAGGLGSAKGFINYNGLQISEDFPLISLASMIAPSPDWFIGINGLDLRSGNPSIENGWKTTFTVDVFPYDAGTEDGTTYILNNSETMPQGVITSRSNTTPFNEKKIGTITLTYVSSTLSTIENTLENTKIYPNPSKGNITVSNIQNLDLKSIEVYNVLGRLVKNIAIKNRVSKLGIDLSNLNKGVYLLNIKTTENTNKTQKLIIN